MRTNVCVSVWRVRKPDFSEPFRFGSVDVPLLPARRPDPKFRPLREPSVDVGHRWGTSTRTPVVSMNRPRSRLSARGAAASAAWEETGSFRMDRSYEWTGRERPGRFDGFGRSFAYGANGLSERLKRGSAGGRMVAYSSREFEQNPPSQLMSRADARASLPQGCIPGAKVGAPEASTP